jgi:hypothetical protein
MPHQLGRRRKNYKPSLEMYRVMQLTLIRSAGAQQVTTIFFAALFKLMLRSKECIDLMLFFIILFFLPFRMFEEVFNPAECRASSHEQQQQQQHHSQLIQQQLRREGQCRHKTGPSPSLTPAFWKNKI